jgi:hypothetical protein
MAVSLLIRYLLRLEKTNVVVYRAGAWISDYIMRFARLHGKRDSHGAPTVPAVPILSRPGDVRAIL